MRIEAIDRSGEHERARVLARSFIAENPNSPLAQRLARLAARYDEGPSPALRPALGSAKTPPAVTGQNPPGR